MYKYLHAFKISTAWYAILAYAIAIATIAELTHFFRCTSTRGSNPRSSRAERVVRPARPPRSPWSGQLVGQRRHGGRGRDGALGSFASGLHGWLRRRPHPQPTQAQWWPQAAVHTDEAEAYQWVDGCRLPRGQCPVRPPPGHGPMHVAWGWAGAALLYAPRASETHGHPETQRHRMQRKATQKQRVGWSCWQ